MKLHANKTTDEVSFWRTIADVLTSIKPGQEEHVLADSTLYKIVTHTHTYSGHIVFQDDVQLKLKTENPRVIKILKQNVQRITIVKHAVPINNTAPVMAWKQL